MWIRVYAGAFLASLCCALMLVPLTMRFAAHFGVLDYPSARKIHAVPMPLLGGFAVFLSMILTVALGFAGMRVLPGQVAQYAAGIANVIPSLVLFFLTLALVVVVGVLDDLYRLSAWKKLFFQVLCGAFTWFAGFKISFFSPYAAVSFILTVGWIVACMNTFNLLDHMDGLSSGVALVAGTLFFLSAALQGHLFIATLLACFLGSVAGFLWYNFPPASVFLGECGSSLLGYVLGTVAIMGTYYRYDASQSFLPVFTPLLIFALPFYDTLSVVVIRLKEKRPVFRGDTSHLSHRLVRLGMSRKQAVLFCYLLALSCGLGALYLANLSSLAGFFVLGQTVCVLACVALLEITGRKE